MIRQFFRCQDMVKLLKSATWAQFYERNSENLRRVNDAAPLTAASLVTTSKTALFLTNMKKIFWNNTGNFKSNLWRMPKDAKLASTPIWKRNFSSFRNCKNQLCDPRNNVAPKNRTFLPDQNFYLTGSGRHLGFQNGRPLNMKTDIKCIFMIIFLALRSTIAK